MEKRNEQIEKILEQFKPKIKKVLQNTHFQEKEDLEQEIKLKIVEKLNDRDVKDPPSFWDIIDE